MLGCSLLVTLHTLVLFLISTSNFTHYNTPLTYVFQEFTKVEQREGEPWPVGRYCHAACCLGYTGDQVHLLVSGGLDRNNKVLKDMWLFNIASNKWKEVRIIICKSCYSR